MLRICSLSTVNARYPGIGAIAVILQLVALEHADAADWYTGAALPKPSSDWIVAVDASATVTSSGSEFAAISGTIAPIGSLNVSGPRLRIEGLAGTYKFDSATPGVRITGEQMGGAILGGYQWKTPSSSFSVFGGVDVRDSQFSGKGVGLPAAGVREGFKAALEYYAAPTERSMIFAYGSYSTIYNAYYTRAKYGIAPIGQIYVGPEIAALGDDLYRQWRVGVHATGLQFGGLQFGVSSGYQVDKSGKGGAYGSLDVRAVY